MNTEIHSFCDTPASCKCLCKGCMKSKAEYQVRLDNIKLKQLEEAER